MTVYILEVRRSSGNWEPLVRSASLASIRKDANVLKAGGHTVRIVESEGTQQDAAARSR